jgi:hypothetical protein
MERVSLPPLQSYGGHVRVRGEQGNKSDAYPFRSVLYVARSTSSRLRFGLACPQVALIIIV